ncbi:ras-related protein Rab-12 [Meriones unguiculatus]|uniref:ras-related protein Rab-12 n=1 Tax=Meriones unguiculatus TaxID=10047 RepID=UPI0010859990|nr:ras-related protein Rab-12 [Meriones unguiculatus]XP_055466135.1 ras-related protein Rab-12 [Psammomys obesus]
MLLPLLRRSCFPSSSPGGGGGGGGAERVEGARGPGARGRRPEREPYACMDPGAALHRRPAGGGLGAVSPALSGGQARRRKQPPRPADFKLQVIIIGSRGVGKTSLMERFTDDTFCEACKSTVGVDFKIKTVELRGKKIRLQIWDTAGQERFNSITSAYYRSAKGIILVYDITKKETFDDLPKWMKMIDKYASEDAELLLVGNKLDCEADREISRQQGEKFAQQVTGMRFCEASAKDNFNVDEIFLKLVDDILKKMPLDILRNELSNSILSLQPEPEIPPELPPPRPHVRCC